MVLTTLLITVRITSLVKCTLRFSSSLSFSNKILQQSKCCKTENRKETRHSKQRMIDAHSPEFSPSSDFNDERGLGAVTGGLGFAGGGGRGLGCGADKGNRRTK
jgi:hypothetical protein